MTNYNLKFIKSEEIATGTMIFYFEKPKDFVYVAGQNADFTLINPSQTDEEGDTRTFSFTSIPSEAELGFATRMRPSAFKNVLKSFVGGEEIQMTGPYGDFTLPENKTQSIVFIIGGIGITPIYSMLKEATKAKSDQKMTLFYANRSQDGAAFLTELLELEKENSNFKLIQIYTQSEVSGENIELGHMNTDILKKYLANINDYKYYLSGPEGMVKAMREMLTNEKISGDNIRTEEFSGY